jgi:hypothetical protein
MRKPQLDEGIDADRRYTIGGAAALSLWSANSSCDWVLRTITGPIAAVVSGVSVRDCQPRRWIESIAELCA